MRTSVRPLILILLTLLLLGLGSSDLLWGPASLASSEQTTSVTSVSLISQINPPAGYQLPVAFGDLGPRLLAAGAIDPARFSQAQANGGHPLTAEQRTILATGSATPITINAGNAAFLLNFFWAVGLTNHNPILTNGPMVQYSEGQIGGFASTGGWTIGAKPAEQLYASTPLIPLTPAQQTRLEEVVSGVYRPCCGNATNFPDCNHGMAMLGLLELLAAQDASADEMFRAAKYLNAFWFPQQTLEQAIFFKATRDQDFAQIPARELVGASFSSGRGFQAVHEWLAEKKLLEQIPQQGGSCGV
jgi:hypothetical protein